MCYLVREQGSDARADAPVPPLRVRPRWMGVAGATLVAGIAVAALVAPQPTARVSDQPGRAGVVPVAMKAGVVPTAAGGSGKSLPADDGVPTATNDVIKAGDCHHGL